MTDRCFLDTNILVYAHDCTGSEKHEKARELVEQLWRDRTGVISTRVLQELYVNVRRQALHALALDQARALIADYLRWEVVINTPQSILEVAEVDILYSEDLSHGQWYETVRVVNPFRK